MYELLRRPDCIARVVDEADAVLGGWSVMP
jgi:hypothetical protein